ncbi:malate dehydrogenase [Desulfomarina profundi]|uniref:Malate dehydrogenase n=1 Tax=Desulfomarina profundi TaxID=2772557 RepID=A0A8D5JLT5_9BACT|nr:NAD-dependent malic enzyme [Desulfomarina profundi]BCL60877.1 malate dehydrogenase [Desulfomarina profundi]
MSANLYRFKYDEYGNTREIITYASGASVSSCSYINKGTAFSKKEREQLALQASLPPGVRNLEAQIESSRMKVDDKVDDIEKYIFIRSLFNRNVTLAHALIQSNIEHFMRLIYTPTVGMAVQKFSSMFRQANGLHFYPGNIDNAEDILRRYANRDIRVAVVTDNQGVLGIGDQGAGGIAVCLGKLMLYTQGAGIAPWHCLPISLDVGTNNETLLADNQYLGWRHRRLEGEEYLSFMGRFVRAFRNVFPNALCQWEDFFQHNAFSIRDAFVDEIISFNDDIQGTGAATLAAIFSAVKIKKEKLEDQVYLIHGAGVRGVGIGEQLLNCLIMQGLTEKEAASRIFIIDSKGLITSNRSVEFYKKKFAKDPEEFPWIKDIGKTDNLTVIKHSGTTALIGTSGQEFCFREEVIEAIRKNTDNPLLLPLFHHVSTPDIFCHNMRKWTDDGALVSTSSPCATMESMADTFKVSQCNNAFVFPGVGLGVLVSGAREVLPQFFTAAARAIADSVSPDDLAGGNLMPDVSQISSVGKKVALAVAMSAVENGVSRPCIYSDFQHNDDRARMEKLIDNIRWKPQYLPLVPM